MVTQYGWKNKYYKSPWHSVKPLWFSVQQKNYTETHGESTELHRDIIIERIKMLYEELTNEIKR